MNQEIIEKTKNYVKKKLENDGSGHDWWHIYRVLQNANAINRIEKANDYTIQLAALLHDISDWKYSDGDEQAGPKLAEKWLTSLQVEVKVTKQVYEIIETISFKGMNSEKPMSTIEGKIVRDADRLDAIGAIGIARCFAFGGSRNRLMHDPNAEFKVNLTEKEYKNLDRKTNTQINHFYEKLLHLKNLMQTQTGRKIAEKRHKFMEVYLDQFFKEWNGKS